MSKIVVLDGFTTNPGDLDWSSIEAYGAVKIYDRTTADQVVKRCQDTEIILTNKVIFDKHLFEQLPNLRLISTLSTGYNTIDIAAANAHKVKVCNVRGYSTPSVAQQVFAYILYWCNQVAQHDASVQKGDWENHTDWCYFLNPLMELKGKTIGIYGLGKIGQQVAQIALSYEMTVLAYRNDFSKGSPKDVRLVDLETLFSKSDFLTLHAPLSADNEGIINKAILSKMKSTAYLINTGRGGLIQEQDLKVALETNVIAGAALDVLSEEPPRHGNVLIGAKNCLITPHNAWMSQASRQRLIDESGKNIGAFLEGTGRNLVS